MQRKRNRKTKKQIMKIGWFDSIVSIKMSICALYRLNNWNAITFHFPLKWRDLFILYQSRIFSKQLKLKKKMTLIEWIANFEWQMALILIYLSLYSCRFSMISRQTIRWKRIPFLFFKSKFFGCRNAFLFKDLHCTWIEHGTFVSMFCLNGKSVHKCLSCK